jgi:hypothetical protein
MVKCYAVTMIENDSSWREFIMQNIDLACGYNIKQLSKDNNNIVEKLCEKCTDYYILSDGVFPSKEEIDKIFIDLPPNKNFEDKFLLGAYKSGELVGIVDIIKDFPTIGEWMLGLMLIEPEERGKWIRENNTSNVSRMGKGFRGKDI